MAPTAALVAALEGDEMTTDPWWDPTCLCCASKRRVELLDKMSPLEEHMFCVLEQIASLDGGGGLLAEKSIEHARLKQLMGGER